MEPAFLIAVSFRDVNFLKCQAIYILSRLKVSPSPAPACHTASRRVSSWSLICPWMTRRSSSSVTIAKETDLTGEMSWLAKSCCWLGRKWGTFFFHSMDTIISPGSVLSTAAALAGRSVPPCTWETAELTKATFPRAKYPAAVKDMEQAIRARRTMHCRASPQSSTCYQTELLESRG